MCVCMIMFARSLILQLLTRSWGSEGDTDQLRERQEMIVYVWREWAEMIMGGPLNRMRLLLNRALISVPSFGKP